MPDCNPGALESYVPPYVRRRVAAGGPPALPCVDELPGALVLADISGFTALSEKLAGDGQGGAEELSKALNAFFSDLIDLVAEHGGEVVGFAGDALLAYWAGPTADLLACAAQAAVGWAQAVTDANRERTRLPNTDLTMCLSLSAGTVYGLHLGGVAGHRLAVVSGDPLDRLSRAERLAAPGDVVLDDAARALLPESYRTRPLEAGYHLLLAGPRPGPTSQTGVGGTPVTASADLAAYIPMHVLEQESSGRGGWLAELRPMTLLFLQLATFGYGRSVEAAQEVASVVQEELARHGTTVNKLTVDCHGTAMVAAAGLPPLAHDDDPVRAVRAALAVAARVEALGHCVHIGVAGGRVFCGPVGNGRRREYTVLGRPVNLAARLAAWAAGESTTSVVLCDEATFEATRHAVEFDDPRSTTIRGMSAAVTTRRALSHRLHTGDARRPTGPLLGRDAEMRAARSARGRAASGGTAAVIVLGEPGIGKSRLLVEIAAEAEADGMRTIRSAGDPVERTVPYHAWRRVFETLLGLRDVGTDADRSRRAAAALSSSDRPLAALLNPVLGLDLPDSPATAALAGDARPASTRALLVALLRRAAGPMMVVLDDAHWFDSASWALAREAAREVPGFLLLIAARPKSATDGDIAELAALPGCHQLRLDPLSDHRVLELATACLGVSTLPDAVAEVLRTRAGGIPFFAQELAYALRDSGRLTVEDGRAVLVGDATTLTDAVPVTVEAALAARVAALDSRTQLVLKVASVIGPAFSADVVAAVYPIVAERPHLAASLALLVERDLAVVDADASHRGYGFRHALTRDAVYRLMLLSQRQELHRGVAQWYESRPEGIAGLHAALGYHWSRAGEPDRGSRHLGLASVEALDHGLAREAVDLGLDAAALLGLNLPRQAAASVEEIPQVLADIDRAVASRDLDDLLSLPSVGDPRAAELMGLLLRIQPAAYMSQQDALYALMGLRNFLLTLEHGGTHFTAGVVSIYASLVRLLQDDPVRAFALSTLSKRLAERDAPAMTAYAGFVHSWLIHHWTQPLASDLPELMDHARRGFEHGDVTFGGFNAAAHVIHLGLCGTHLDRVEEAGATSAALISGRVASAAFHCRHEAQAARALAGRTVDLCSLTDRGTGGVEEERDLGWVRGSQLTNQTGYYLVWKLRLHYYAGHFAIARGFAAEVAAIRPAIAGQAIEAEYVLFAALAELGGSGSAAAARDHLRQLRKWQERAPMNFRHKALLVQGELTRAAGEPQRAAVLLREAAASARTGGFQQHEALAFELAAVAHRKAGDLDAARAAGEAAIEGYRRWGAQAKADSLSRAPTTSPAHCDGADALDGLMETAAPPLT